MQSSSQLVRGAVSRLRGLTVTESARLKRSQVEGRNGETRESGKMENANVSLVAGRMRGRRGHAEGVAPNRSTVDFFGRCLFEHCLNTV